MKGLAGKRIAAAALGPPIHLRLSHLYIAGAMALVVSSTEYFPLTLPSRPLRERGKTMITPLVNQRDGDLLA